MQKRFHLCSLYTVWMHRLLATWTWSVARGGCRVPRLSTFALCIWGRHSVARELALLEIASASLPGFTAHMENPEDGPFCLLHQPHAKPSYDPLPSFCDFILFPSPFLPFWFFTGPLGSGRCTWGAFEGLCQELEWSLYELAFNAAPVSPRAIIEKPVSSLLWSIALQSCLLPARRGAYKDLLGGCDAPFQSRSWIAPLPHLLPHARTRHRDTNRM